MTVSLASRRKTISFLSVKILNFTGRQQGRTRNTFKKRKSQFKSEEEEFKMKKRRQKTFSQMSEHKTSRNKCIQKQAAKWRRRQKRFQVGNTRLYRTRSTKTQAGEQAICQKQAEQWRASNPSSRNLRNAAQRTSDFWDSRDDYVKHSHRIWEPKIADWIGKILKAKHLLLIRQYPLL